MMNINRCFAVQSVVLCVALWPGAAPMVHAQDWKPQRNVDIVVNSGAGGSADRQARVAQKFVQA